MIVCIIKWKIKCKNVLDCELTMLLEARTCKKVVAWSGDFGIGQYISWDLPPGRSVFGSNLGESMKNSARHRQMKLELDLTC